MVSYKALNTSSKSKCYSDTKVAGIIYHTGIRITDYITQITDKGTNRQIRKANIYYHGKCVKTFSICS